MSTCDCNDCLDRRFGTLTCIGCGIRRQCELTPDVALILHQQGWQLGAETRCPTCVSRLPLASTLSNDTTPTADPAMPLIERRWHAMQLGNAADALRACAKLDALIAEQPAITPVAHPAVPSETQRFAVRFKSDRRPGSRADVCCLRAATREEALEIAATDMGVHPSRLHARYLFGAAALAAGRQMARASGQLTGADWHRERNVGFAMGRDAARGGK